MNEFLKILSHAFETGECLSLVLSKPRRDADNPPDRVTARPVVIGEENAYQFASRRNGQETHENQTPAAAAKKVAELLGPVYAHCHLYTAEADFSARATTTGKIRFRRSAATKSGSAAAHNRSKSYLILDGEPCPFLAEIGVMTNAGRVRQSRYKKFRQINRYLELVNDVYEQLPAEGTINAVDFGCGKSYLTFALHHLLTSIHQRRVNIVGLDRNTSVIETCREIAARLQCQGLEFREGDIAVHAADGPVHLAVSLHACDTATDDALAQAIRWQADVILAVPCCQHELAGKIESAQIAGLLGHGILKERFAALTTDALRAAALGLCGYRTQVVEFIDMEHTAKNILLRGVRGEENAKKRAALVREYEQLKAAAGLQAIYLEEAVGAELTRHLGR